MPTDPIDPARLARFVELLTERIAGVYGFGPLVIVSRNAAQIVLEVAEQVRAEFEPVKPMPDVGALIHPRGNGIIGTAVALEPSLSDDDDDDFDDDEDDGELVDNWDDEPKPKRRSQAATAVHHDPFAQPKAQRAERKFTHYGLVEDEDKRRIARKGYRGNVIPTTDELCKELRRLASAGVMPSVQFFDANRPATWAKAQAHTARLNMTWNELGALAGLRTRESMFIKKNKR